MSLGLGAAVVPTFEGSDRYKALPVPIISITYRDMISFDPILQMGAESELKSILPTVGCDYVEDIGPCTGGCTNDDWRD